MNRLRRRLALVTLVVLVASGAASCGFVQPPALTLARDASSPPFFTFTADDLFAELNKSSSAAGGTTTVAPLVDAERVAEVLTSKVRPKIVEQLMADRKVTVTDEDRAMVDRMAQQQQQQPTEDEMAFQANLFALSRVLSEDFFSKPGNDLEDYARRYYEQRRDSFTQAAQTCLHVLTVDAPTEPAADPFSQPKPPTPAAIDDVLPQAQALRQRLNNEPFEEVHKASGESALEIPGGNLGCRNDSDLPPDLMSGIKDVPVGTVSQPVRWQLGWIIARIDDRKAQRTPPFEEIRNDVITATQQTFGNQFVSQLLENVYKSFAVTVDPRFGRWSPERGQVLTPEGAAPAPTAPTTTTTPTLTGEAHAEPDPAPTSTTGAP